VFGVTRGWVRFLGASCALALVACTTPPPEPAPEPARLGHASRVVRAVFHDTAVEATGELGSGLLPRIAQRLAIDSAAGDPPLDLDFQFARIEVSRRLRLATLPLALATVSLYALLGPDAWEVTSRLHGRLRVRDASGCVIAESVAKLEYRVTTRFGAQLSPPESALVLDVVDRLVERSARRLAR